MISFFPRDISLWRETFDFEDRANYPKMKFSDPEGLKNFIMSHYTDDNGEYPVRFVEGVNNYFGTTHYVMKWTVIGWMKEEK